MNSITRAGISVGLCVFLIGSSFASPPQHGSNSVQAEQQATAQANLFLGEELVNAGEPTAGMMTVMPGSIPTVTSIRDHTGGVPETQALLLRDEILSHFEQTISVPRVVTTKHTIGNYRFMITTFQSDLPPLPGPKQYFALSEPAGYDSYSGEPYEFAWSRSRSQPTVTTPISRVLMSESRFPSNTLNYVLARTIEVKCDNEDGDCNADVTIGSMMNFINQSMPSDLAHIPSVCTPVRGTVGDKWNGGATGFSGVASSILTIGSELVTGGIGPSHTYGRGSTIPTLGELGMTCFVLQPNSGRGVPQQLSRYDAARVGSQRQPGTHPGSTTVYLPSGGAGSQPIAIEDQNGATKMEIYTPQVIIHQSNQ